MTVPLGVVSVTNGCLLTSTETLWTTKPKVFTLPPFTVKVGWSALKRRKLSDSHCAKEL